MATTLFDLNIEVTSPAPIKGISQESKGALFKRPVLETRKPREAGSVFRAQQDEPEEEQPLELEEISEAYTELIDRAEAILERLKERLSGLTYTFDPTQEPILSDTVGRVFQGASDAITYKMYLAALQLDKDIAVEIGESESGFVR